MDQMEAIRSRLSILERDNQIILDELYALQKELEGILDEDDGAGGAGEEISKAVTIQVPEENAMTNPLILSKIFSHLEASTLVGFRLVCKAWDEVAISMPEFSKRVHLHLFKVFPCCTVIPVAKINPKLTKNICIYSDRFNENQCKDQVDQRIHAKKANDAAAENLMTFFNQYHRHVQNIKFDATDFNSFSSSRHILLNILLHLVEALNTLDFPKLQRIVLKDVLKTDYYGYSFAWDHEEWQDYEVVSTFAARPNIISLQLDNTIAGNFGSPFHDIFQKLINCAPNLEEITIRGNFYPDLSTCKNLKVLNYSGMPYYYYYWDSPSEEPSFNLKSLSKMLGQVKHSLIKLSLEDSYLESKRHDENDHSQQEFNFPDVAKNLEFLCIQENSGKCFFQSEMMKLNPSQFPKLKNLVIGVKKGYSFDMQNPGEETLDNVVRGISYSFGTVSSLHLSGTLRPDIGHRIRTLFPNLIKLTMPWSAGGLDEDEDEYDYPDFDSVVDCCSGWKLRELEICHTWLFDWSSFMKGLDRLKQTQNDLRMLKLRLTPPANYFVFDKEVCHLWYDTKKQQQLVGTVIPELPNLSFGPESMRKAIEETVLQFVLVHYLTVHFL